MDGLARPGWRARRISRYVARWEWVRWVNEEPRHARTRPVEVTITKMNSGKRRPYCFNLSVCTDPDLSKNGRLLEPADDAPDRRSEHVADRRQPQSSRHPTHRSTYSVWAPAGMACQRSAAPNGGIVRLASGEG